MFVMTPQYDRIGRYVAEIVPEKAGKREDSQVSSRL